MPTANALEEDKLGLRTKINASLLSNSSRGRGQGYALWKTDAQPGAYRFNLHYRIGPEVKATVILVRYPSDPKAQAEGVATFSLSAPPQTIVEAVVCAVVEHVATAEARKPK